MSKVYCRDCKYLAQVEDDLVYYTNWKYRCNSPNNTEEYKIVDSWLKCHRQLSKPKISPDVKNKNNDCDWYKEKDVEQLNSGISC